MNYTFNDIPQCEFHKLANLKFYTIVAEPFNLQIAIDTSTNEIIFPLIAETNATDTDVIVNLIYYNGAKKSTVEILKNGDAKRLAEILNTIETFDTCALDGIEKVKQIIEQ